jgi:hypothetical protein
MNEYGATAAGATGGQIVKELSTDLFKAKGWMKLIGVLSIIQGILMIFTLWGVIICWLPIWMGILLNRSAGRIEMAYLNGDRAMSREGMQNLQKYFTINGVLALISVIIFAVGLFAAFTLGGLGLLSSLGQR